MESPGEPWAEKRKGETWASKRKGGPADGAPIDAGRLGQAAQGNEGRARARGLRAASLKRPALAIRLYCTK